MKRLVSAEIYGFRAFGGEQTFDLDADVVILSGPKDSVAAFCMAFTRSVYLQQDLVREFIESDSEEDRFTVMSELLGAGRLNEFLRDIERDRNAWSRTRTERAREASEAVARASQIR